MNCGHLAVAEHLFPLGEFSEILFPNFEVVLVGRVFCLARRETGFGGLLVSTGNDG